MSHELVDNPTPSKASPHMRSYEMQLIKYVYPMKFTWGSTRQRALRALLTVMIEYITA